MTPNEIAKLVQNAQQIVDKRDELDRASTFEAKSLIAHEIQNLINASSSDNLEQKTIDLKRAGVLKAFAGRLRNGEHEQVLLTAVAMELEIRARELEEATQA
jgi:hypothetical protein